RGNGHGAQPSLDLHTWTLLAKVDVSQFIDIADIQEQHAAGLRWRFMAPSESDVSLAPVTRERRRARVQAKPAAVRARTPDKVDNGNVRLARSATEDPGGLAVGRERHALHGHTHVNRAGDLAGRGVDQRQLPVGPTTDRHDFRFGRGNCDRRSDGRWGW